MYSNSKTSANKISFFARSKVELSLARQIHTNVLQLFQLPLEIQDNVIEEISYLNCCSQSEVKKIIQRYLQQL
jgi:hypothetical protein